MPRASKYPPEFRDRCVRIARESERPIAAVARDLGVHPETLRLWVRQDEADDGTRSDQLTTAEREELTALRREVRDLRRSTEQTRRRSPLQMLESYTQQAARETVASK
jgi:transposase